MANTHPDDVALLKQELSQFLLAEITSADDGTAFRREVADQVAAVIDQILTERLKPALDNLERQSAENASRLGALMEDARRQMAASAGDPATAQNLSDMGARMDELRHRIGRLEDAAKPGRAGGGTAQPLQGPGRSEAKLADERLAAPRPSGPSLPRWMLWMLLLLLAATVFGLANLYYEKLSKPDAAPVPVSFAPPPASHTPAPSPVPLTPSPQQAATVPPQTVAAAPPQVTPTPAPAVPSPAQHIAHIPADFAIERGWLAAQPFAVDPRLARRVGSTDALPTLKSLVCGRSPNCTSDSLMTDGTEGKQLIALQMLMSQIGDRFCVPRRSVTVTGSLSASVLADLAAIADCAGGAPARCTESQTRVCAPDADALQSGSSAARSALLRWALWRIGSI